MTGPEHYVQAERFLASAGDADSASPLAQYFLNAAQVHATLASVAATTMAATPQFEPRSGRWVAGMSPEDFGAWNDVTGLTLTWPGN